MTHFKCIFKGAARNEGRFGPVVPGQELFLTKHEYKCVAEDSDFQFVEELQVEERIPIPGNPSGPSTDPKSPGNPGAVKEPGRVAAADPSPEEDDYDEGLAAFEDLDDSEELAPEYTLWKKEALVREVEERNEGREEALRLPSSGTKAELIAVLEGDDL
jgi:hypothetical protein